MSRWFIGIIILLAILAAAIWIPKMLESRGGEVRAAMDIGSGATNLKIARVNPETNKIISQIFEKSVPVPYQKHLEQSPNQTFDAQVMDQGIQAIKTLKEVADKYQVKKVIAVATAAFRKAHNAEAFAREIEKQTGVQVRIIDQDEEGVLAFRGALAITPANPDQTVVWDIGGGSMQLTTLTEPGTYLVEKGKTASIPFKNAIIQEIKHQNPAEVQSPNPLSEQDMRAALHYAGRLALETDPMIQAKIYKPSTQILAVGNLFNYGVLPLVDKGKVIDAERLGEAVFAMAGKTDAELPGGSLVEVAISNPLLVLGYMQALGIRQVDVVSVNNADGALTYPAYWQ